MYFRHQPIAIIHWTAPGLIEQRLNDHEQVTVFDGRLKVFHASSRGSLYSIRRSADSELRFSIARAGKCTAVRISLIPSRSGCYGYLVFR
jgi:hypothetical protein